MTKIQKWQGELWLTWPEMLICPPVDPAAGHDDSTKIHMHFGTCFTYWHTYEAEIFLNHTSFVIKLSNFTPLCQKKMFTHTRIFS